MKNIILISGKAEAGKSTCAKYLKKRLENQGEKIIITRFAKYLKMYMQDVYDWDGITKDEFYRTKLQIIGTDVIKEKLNYKAFHAKRLAEDVEIYKALGVDTVIIDDARFRDEVHLFKAMFPDECITVRINRYDHKSKLTDEQLKHKSECDLDDFKFDYVIHTRKSDIQQLKDECDRVLGKVLGYIR